MSEKKSFSDNAKGFLSSWKESFAEKNKEIFEQKKKREEEAEELKQKISEQFEEIKADLKGIAKDIYDTLNREFEGFMTALKEGTATLNQKLELEQRIEQMKLFLKTTGSKSAEKFNQIADEMKLKISGFDTELQSERDDYFEDIKNDVEKIVITENTKKTEETSKNHKNIKDLFGGI